MTYLPGTGIPVYGFCMVLGIGIGGILACFLIYKNGLNVEKFILFMSAELILTIIMAKLFYVCFEGENILTYVEIRGASIFKSGYSFYGGVIGLVIGIVIAVKVMGDSVLKYIPICVFSVPFVYAFIKVGCCFSSCCYGIKYTGAGAILYHDTLFAPKDVALFPVQLVDALCNMCLAAYLFLKSAKKKATMTDVFIYGYTYAVLRFFLEFLRGDVTYNICGLSVSQVISIGIVAGLSGRNLWKHHH